MTLLAQYALTGVVTGCFLILATIGFSLTRQVEGFLNIAHAELLGVSAFITWGLNAGAGWPIVPAAIVAIVATAFIGLFIGRVVYDPIRRLGPAVVLISSVGVAYVIAGLMHAIIGTGIRTLDVPLATTFKFFGLRITNYQMIVVGLAALTGISLALFPEPGLPFGRCRPTPNWRRRAALMCVRLPVRPGFCPRALPVLPGSCLH